MLLLLKTDEKNKVAFSYSLTGKQTLGKKIVLEGQKIQTDLILLNVDTFFQQDPGVKPPKIILGRKLRVKGCGLVVC